MELLYKKLSYLTNIYEACYILSGENMESIGIICEYSPFHNGHLYHINKIKELFKDSTIILVINGYFLERGSISLMSKANKTKIALEYGVDLVLELPTIYGTQSADVFASKSIEILNKFHVNRIVFGSESDNISNLESIAKKQIENKNEINKLVKENLKTGMSYPVSLAKSLNIDEIKPNDLLGISYIKCILENKYNIEYTSIKRTNEYLDVSDNSSIISATNIRKKLQDNKNINKFIPGYKLELISKIDYDKLFELLKYKIITDNYLDNYLDVTEGLDKKLKNVIYKSNSMEELINNIKSKRYTFNRVNRMLAHILLGIEKDVNDIKNSYIRVLGFNNKGKIYLNKIKKDINTCIDKNSYIYKYELVAASLYELVTNTKCLQFELAKKPIYVEKCD